MSNFNFHASIQNFRLRKRHAVTYNTQRPPTGVCFLGATITLRGWSKCYGGDQMGGSGGAGSWGYHNT